MHQTYNKLVRDNIPEIITRTGSACEIETMDEQEFQVALRAKLVEEAQEAATATDGQQLITELADFYEVIDTLMNSNGLTQEAVRAEQEHRRVSRGGFSRRIRLLSTSDNT